ncbi:MAG: acetate/propionate family kinase [Acidobacteriota bacterium]
MHESAELIRLLKEQVSLFKTFEDERIEELVRGSRQITIEPNESVIRFGEEGRFLGILLDGQAEVSVTDDRGDKHPLHVLQPGEIFGEMSLMTGDRTMADVIGLTRCRALLVPQRLFSTLIASHPPSVVQLSRTIVERLRSMAYEEKGSELAASALRRSEDPYGFLLRTEEPVRILVINCGSSSLKYNLFDTADPQANARGGIERIGEDGTRLTQRTSRGETRRDLPRGGHGQAFAAMIEAMTTGDGAVLRSPGEVSAVGHRVVHGGDRHSHATVVTDDVIKDIEQAASFAPLHNPVNLIGIREARALFPDAPQVAVFDTAFHQNMPPYAYLYGLPYEYYEGKHLRRYGFHGISHKYVSLKVAEYMKRPYNELETVVCHLGNGASICAIDHGRSVDTSMGLTPAEGLMMGTRCGDMDPAILVHLMQTEGLGPDALNRLINKEGGLRGLSGVSNDMREIEAAAEAGSHRALLALKTFSYRVRKYVGAYVAAMGGIDALAFTGGIGQGSVGVRSLACQGLSHMGIRIDEQKNRDARGFERVCDISAEDSVTHILVVPTDEERMIARETLRALERGYVADILSKQEPTPVPIEVLSHHVHLAQEHVEALFGPGHQLTPVDEGSWPGRFLCEERLRLVGPKGHIDDVRVHGPARRTTQVEIALTEQFRLGVDAPIRESGDLENTPGVWVVGSHGSIALDKGVICAMRHIHMTPEDALRMGLKDKDVVQVSVPGERRLIFGDVLVRVSPTYKLAMHLDTDEGNAANITAGAIGHVDSIQGRKQ